MSAIRLYKPNPNHFAHPDDATNADLLWNRFLDENLYAAYEIEHDTGILARKRYLICSTPKQITYRFEGRNVVILIAILDDSEVQQEFIRRFGSPLNRTK